MGLKSGHSWCLTIFLFLWVHFSSSSAPPNIIITAIEPTYDIPKDNILSGTNYLVCPKTANVTLKCEANFPTRWATNLPILRYDLPLRYAREKNNSKWKLPDNVTYVSFLVFALEKFLPNDGFVTCASVKENISSNLIIPGNASHEYLYETRRYCTDFLGYWVWDHCPNDITKLGLIQYNQSNYDYKRGRVCDNWAWIITDMKILRPEYFSPITLDSLKETNNLAVQGRRENCTPDSLFFPNGRQHRRKNCRQYYCTNPFDCNLKDLMIVKDPERCDFDGNTWKINCPNKFPSSVITCQDFLKTYYIFNYYIFKKVNSSLDWCSELEFSQLLKIEKTIHSNGTTSYTCFGAAFVLGRQLIFSVKNTNGTERFLSKFTEDDHSTELIDGILISTLEHIPPDTKELICRAPRFDSELWLNVSEPILQASTADERSTSTNRINTTEAITTDEETVPMKSTTTFTIVTTDAGAEASESSVTNQIVNTAGNGNNLTQEPFSVTTSTTLDIEDTLMPGNSGGSTDSKNVTGTQNSNFINENLWNIVIVGVAAVIIVILITTSIICGVRRYRSKHLLRQLTNSEMLEFMKGIPRMSTNKFTESMSPMMDPFEKEIPESDLSIELGQLPEKDGFMSAYPGSVNGRSAIVRTTDLTTNIFFFLKVLKDIKFMQRVGQQPNIVELLGAVTLNIKDRVISVAIESSNRGNVKEYLQRNCQKKAKSASPVPDDVEVPGSNDDLSGQSNEILINAVTLLNWCEQIATGMAFLQKETLVHGDLSASNILLFSDNLIKISELCPCRQDFYREQYLKNFKPPPKWRWMAIELLRSKKFTIKSDVWAFGVTMWEILSLGEDPHPGIKWAPEFVLQLENGYRMEMPIIANNDVYQILLRCWYRYPNDRINFAKIQESIHECREKCTTNGDGPFKTSAI